VIRFLFLSLIFIAELYSKVLYISDYNAPDRVIKGEIFPITIKVLSTLQEHRNVTYKFLNISGLKPLNRVPEREIKGNYYFETFYFLTTSVYAKLPDIEAKLSLEENSSTVINGSKLNVVKLNPKDNFSNIIADSFEIVNYKTTSYDDKHNIIVLMAKATNSSLSMINFKNVYKQEIESIKKSYKEPSITYIIVIDKKIDNFNFSYFSLKKNKFEEINIPIIVEDDGVATQTDLKPTNQTHEKVKMYIAIVLTLILILFILWRKKYVYLFLILFPLLYIAQKAIPEKDICIKKGSAIHLLPVHNGTIFELTQNISYLPKEGEIKNFTKVKLKNEKIGWVENEDTCSY